MAFYVLMAVFGSQGIVVKCTAAIFFSYGGLSVRDNATNACKPVT